VAIYQAAWGGAKGNHCLEQIINSMKPALFLNPEWLPCFLWFLEV